MELIDYESLIKDVHVLELMVEVWVIFVIRVNLVDLQTLIILRNFDALSLEFFIFGIVVNNGEERCIL